MSPGSTANVGLDRFLRLRSEGAAVGGHAGWSDLRDRLSRFIEHPESSKPAAAFQAAIVALILVSTLSVTLETVPEIGQGHAAIFSGVEAAVTVLFSVELALRFFASQSAPAFFTSGFNVVDLVAILPGFTAIFGHCSASRCQASDAMISLRMLRLMWLMRILRLAKVARHVRLLSICFAVLTQVWHSSIAVILGLMLTLMIASSTLLHLVEYDRCEARGVHCEGFESIPSSCWFAISTLTTVGYGDVIPQTMLGKLIAVISSICAVLMLALSGALFSYDFSEHFREERHRSVLELKADSEHEHDQELRELMALSTDVRRACDAMLHGLAAAAQRRMVEAQGFAAGSHSAASFLARPLHADAEDDSIPESAESDEFAPFSTFRLSPITMPMLRMLEDRGRIFCHEVQGCVLATSVDARGRPEDLHDYISSYDGADCEEEHGHALPSGISPVSGV